MPTATPRRFARLLKATARRAADEAYAAGQADALAVVERVRKAAPPAEPEGFDGCVLIPLLEASGDAVRSFAAKLDPADVIEAETDPHVTVRYGLNATPAQVTAALADAGPAEFVVSGPGMFAHDGQDVLYLNVADCDGLFRLRERLAALPHRDTFPGYLAHATVAYLRPGTAHKYLNWATDPEGHHVGAGEAVYHPPGDGEPVHVPLDGQVLKAAAYDESKHPRADDGKFGSGPGSGGPAPPDKAAKTAARRERAERVADGLADRAAKAPAVARSLGLDRVAAATATAAQLVLGAGTPADRSAALRDGRRLLAEAGRHSRRQAGERAAAFAAALTDQPPAVRRAVAAGLKQLVRADFHPADPAELTDAFRLAGDPTDNLGELVRRQLDPAHVAADVLLGGDPDRCHDVFETALDAVFAPRPGEQPAAYRDRLAALGLGGLPEPDHTDPTADEYAAREEVDAALFAAGRSLASDWGRGWDAHLGRLGRTESKGLPRSLAKAAVPAPPGGADV